MNKIELRDMKKLKYGRREAINSLKTNIRFSGANIKVIEFTSCVPNEGKSTTSFDVARAFAASGEKVLLIDTDMRKSAMVKTHNIKSSKKNMKGIVHYLAGQCEIDDIILETNIDGMHMILSGPYSPNPTELLESSRFDALIEEVRDKYDIVIIDSPPLGSVIDAAIIAPKCDGVVLVIESGATSVKTAEDVVKQLEMTGCKLLGCVLNKVPQKNGAYAYKYKYRYKYYGEKGDRR